jgi:hypothetical protein
MYVDSFETREVCSEGEIEQGNNKGPKGGHHDMLVGT